MTVETLNSFTDWQAANGSNKNWTYDFVIRDQTTAFIEYKDGADGAITRVSNNINFIPDADYVGGTLQYPATGAALANTYFVRVVREVPYTQTAAIGLEGAFFPENHEAAFDRTVLQTQQLGRDSSRTPKLPLGETAGVWEEDIPDGNILISDGANGVKDGGVSPGSLQDQVDAAVAAASSAETSASSAAGDAATTAADRIAVAADKATVAADKATVAADKATVSADRVLTGGYRDEVEADRIEVQADKVLAAGFADDAAASAADALEAYEQIIAYGDFSDRYLGDKAADPTNWNSASPLDPGTDPLIPGLVYYNTVASEYRTYSGSVWASGAIDTSDFSRKSANGSDYVGATFRTNLDLYSTAQIDAMPGAVPAKTTPVDADSWQIWDSVASAWKRVTGTNLKMYLKAYLDTLYATVSHSHLVAELSDASANAKSFLQAANYAAMVALLSAVTTARNITTQHSLTGGGNLSADRTLSLVNDTATPGNNKVYGTNSGGTRGWKDDPVGDFQYVGSQTAAANAFIKFDSSTGFTIASGYDYIFRFEGLRPTVDAYLLYQQATGGGPTYQNSGYKSVSVRGGTEIRDPVTTGGAITANSSPGGAGGATEDIAGEFIISNLGANQVHEATFYGRYVTNTGDWTNFIGGARRNTAEAVTGIQFYASSGNLTGTIKCYRRRCA